jgi:LysR family hydrogen peroxide-inducible transcriptional activator
MNLQVMRYLVALAEHRHFGKAATACFISQPTLSMQIKKLEEELNVQLLERTNKSVMLTEVGMRMAGHARNILAEVARMREQAKMALDPEAGEIKIGIIPTLAPYVLPRIIPRLTKTFPKLEYYLLEAKTESLLEQLLAGQLDAAILSLPIENDHLVSYPFWAEEFLLAVSKHHSWAERRSVRSDELAQANVLLLEEGHCLRDQALAVCQQLGDAAARGFRATSLETLRHMVAANVGVTLMPKLACDSREAVRYIPVSGKKLQRKLAWVWRKTTSKAPLLLRLAETTKLIFEKT